MENETKVKYFDVIIAGAGPAGCACALRLKDAGLKVALFDKENFPRDKVCGDAIPGRAINTLQNISPDFANQFKAYPLKYTTKKTNVYYKQRFLEFHWLGQAYTCSRMDFDNFLFTLVKEHTETEIFLNRSLTDVKIQNNTIRIKDKISAEIFEAKMIIGSDGAQSVLAKQLANRTIDRRHHIGSVRAYFKNVSQTENNTNEIYFNKKFVPGYLWIFPLQENTTNVGFGMLSSKITKERINLKKTFYDFIAQDPQLSLRFKNATQTGELAGFGLPLGSRRVKISGSNFMLTGDAASLIDPITGDGIGNAMLSGRLAAEQVVKCFDTSDFSAKNISNYDKSLFNAIGQELKIRYKTQKVFSAMPFLIDTIFMASKNKMIKNLIQKKL